MTAVQVEIQLVAVVVAVACALPGTFLVLRRMAMMSDAISHAILVGIVVAFFVTRDLSSPLLVLGASATGLLTVALVEVLERSGRVNADAALGLVFPALFSVGVVLVAQFADNVHLDVDSVLLGELAFAPFSRFVLAGVDMGPRSLYVGGGILLLNLSFILLFFKELKLSTFDAGLAAALGFSPVLLHYALMGLVSVTAVGAFDAVGSILVVALMVAPPAAAYLLTDRLGFMLVFAAAIGAGSAVAGYWVAHLLDASIAGCMAGTAGLYFLLAYLFSPSHGLAALSLARRRIRWQFAQETLVVHLLHHQGTAEADEECRIDHLQVHLHWTARFAGSVLRRALGRGLVVQSGELLELTARGRKLARESMAR